MIDSLDQLLLGVFAILPGLLGVWLYRTEAGFDWRTPWWQQVLQMVLFSALGIAAYALCTSLPVLRPFEWLAPVHVFPDTYVSLSVDEGWRVAVPYLGHSMFSALIGWLSAIALAKFAGSKFAAVWDEFAGDCTHERWVVVTLKQGDVYAGHIRNVEKSVSSADRDIILQEPALYDETNLNYMSTPYQYLYLQADSIDSIGALALSTDKRLVQVGEYLMQEGSQSDVEEE